MINAYLPKRCRKPDLRVRTPRFAPPAAGRRLEFMKKLGQEEMPFVMKGLTKADKQSTTQTRELIATYLTKMGETWDELPRHFVTSAETALAARRC
ncbi:MAG: hypothetical protein WKG07_33575 [Hymenobacter sp.]